MKWITNVGDEVAFLYLMKYSINNPDKVYQLGAPAGVNTPAVCWVYLDDWTKVPLKSRAFSVEQLEEMGIRGLYEV